MKKTIMTMLIALVAIFASAETYSHLKFTKTNGSTVTYSAVGLKLTYDATVAQIFLIIFWGITVEKSPL